MKIITLPLLTMGCAAGTMAEDGEGSLDDASISSLSPGVSEFTLEQEVAGVLVNRRFLVHAPEGFDASKRTPLLFAFHGNGGVPDSFVPELGEMIEEEEVVGVYPEGVEYSWNLGREASEADDVAFTEAILSMLNDTDGVDASSPIAMGFSNGTGMVHELAMESEHFVGISPVISHMLASKTPGEEAAPVSVLQFSGTEDDLVPYDGGVGVLDHDFLSAEDSSAAWAAHNGCESSPSIRASGNHDILEWENCVSGRRVVHVRMDGVGHDMPADIEGGTLPFMMDFLLASRR